MKLYKLTDQDSKTYNNTIWGEGITHSAVSRENPQMCSKDVLHAYADINVALLLNPLHAKISDPIPWEAEGEIVIADALKVGCYSLTTVKQIPFPDWYIDSSLRKRVCVQFAILCAEKVLSLFEKKFTKDQRPGRAIEAAKAWLDSPTEKTADADAAADAAAYAAYAATAAARAAAAAAADGIDFALLAREAISQQNTRGN